MSAHGALLLLDWGDVGNDGVLDGHGRGRPVKRDALRLALGNCNFIRSLLPNQFLNFRRIAASYTTD